MQKAVRKSKIIICVISIFVILVTLSLQETNAFYATKGIARNVVTTGDISMWIKEMQDGKPYPDTTIEVKAKSVVNKEVSIVNSGENSFWVRVKLVKDSEEKGADPSSVMTLDINDKDWTYVEEDGFYYYNKEVQPGTETAKLFTNVTFADEIDLKFMEKEVSLAIDAYAVQSIHNGNTPFEAKGWPEES